MANKKIKSALSKAGRPPAQRDAKAARMQIEAREQMEAKGLKNIDLVKAIGMSEGAIGRALSAKPAANTPTLRAITNHLFPPSAAQDLRVHANALAQRSPETAALLSAVFREIAELLTHPAASPDRPRSS